MLLTEEQARRKQCPFTFTVNEIRRLDGEGIREAGPWPCVGSDCMAWCWEAERYFETIIWYCADSSARDEPPKPAGVDFNARFIPGGLDSDYGARWVESDEHKEARRQDWLRNRRGYCGLVGSHDKPAE